MRLLTSLVLVLAVSGCASKPMFNTLAVGAYVDKEIGRAGEEKRYASLYPRALERYARDTVRVHHPETPAEDLLVLASGRFNGSLDDLVKFVASKTRYAVSADGERSGAPILVSVQLDGYPIIGLLREGFGQGKGQAWLEIDQSRRVMTVHYIRRESSPVPHLDDHRL